MRGVHHTLVPFPTTDHVDSLGLGVPAPSCIRDSIVLAQTTVVRRFRRRRQTSGSVALRDIRSASTLGVRQTYLRLLRGRRGPSGCGSTADRRSASNVVCTELAPN